MHKSIIIDADFYKTTHAPLFAPGTTGLFSYAESRGGEYSTIILFGLQGWVKDNLLKPITEKDIEYADRIISGMGGVFDRTPWDIIRNEYGGYLPVTIKAVPEGKKIPYKNAIVTVECTDPRLFWLVGYIETALIRLWYPTTIASKAYVIRKNIDALYLRYADTSVDADFAFLDFSGRGVECFEAGALATAAFLTSFKGTDTMAGVSYASEFYGGCINGFSVRATEHSVMCSYGEENEEFSFEHIIDTVPNGSTISVVCDTWDIYQACEYWNKLAKKIEEKNITLVIRPDSGDPQEVLPKMLRILEKGFKTHLNDKGLKVFNNIKLLWGDGISEENYLQVLCIMPKNGFGVEVLMLGSGGGLMQNVNRDTCKFAFKASAVFQKGMWRPIRKRPITDPGKHSKAGRLELVEMKDGSGFRTVDETLAAQFGKLLLEVVYKNGVLHRDQTMNEIREIVKQ